MPALTPAQIAELEDHPHILGRQYLYVFVPNVVFTSTVIGDIGRVQVVPYAVTGGTWADTRRGMTLWVGTTAGAQDKGVIRIRGIDANNLYVSEHEIDLDAGDHLTVLDEYRLWHINPYIHTDGTIYKDWNGVAVGGALAFPANVDDIYMPVPVMGPHSIEFLESGVATHAWDWRNSWTISPNSGALTYFARFPEGTPASTFATNGTVEWDTTDLDANNRCEKWVTLSLTDDMGVGLDVLAYTARRLYITLDRDNLPDNCYVDFVPSPRMGSVDQGGFGMSFTVHIDAPESAFPDGALVIWFFDGGTQDDISGNWPGRSHIHFIGHIRKASTHKEPMTGHVTFDATTLQGVMRALPMFPNFLETAAAPTIWTQAASLTVQRAAYLHMRWMSSIFEIADVMFVPNATTPIGEHEFPEGFLYDQLNALVNRDYLYRIGCDPLSTVYINKDPQLQATHPGIATIMDIQAQDWREELDFPEPLEPQTSYVIASGNAYAAGTLTPLFSEAPGPVPLQLGRKDKSLSRLICTTQAALNTLSGLALAAANNDFPDIPVKLDGQYYIGHLFPMEFIELDIGITDTKRRMDLSSDLFIPRRSSLQVVYDVDRAVSNGLVDINVERLTEGVDGQSLVYPVGPPTPPGPASGPEGGDWEPPVPVAPTPTVAGALVASHDLDGVYWSDNRGGSWEHRRTGAFLGLVWDPWWRVRTGTSDPAYSILWGCGVGFVVRSGQDAGVGAWTDVTPTTNPPNTWNDAIPPEPDVVTYKQVHGDMTALDTFYALAEWQEAGGDWRGWVAKTTDNGVSWTWTALSEFLLIGNHYYASQADTFAGSVNERHPWAAAIDVSNAWGYEDEELAVDSNANTYGQFYRGETFAQAGFITWRMHFGVGFTRAAGKIPIELRMRLASPGSATLAAECRLWPDQNPAGHVAGAHDYVFPGVDPTGWTGPGAVIVRTVDMTNHDVTEYVGFSVIGANLDTNVHLAYARIHENYADALPPSRPLAMDLDTEDGTRFYVTVWHDGELYLENRPSATLNIVTHREDIGAATAGQVANKTRFIVPRQSHLLAAPDGDLVWVFGRWDDGTPRHIAYSTNGGASFVSREDAAWNANHRVGALDVFFDNQTVYAFINHAATPRLWGSIDQGVNWTNVNSMPLNIEFEAEYRCTWAADEFIIGSNVAGVQMAAWIQSPYTGTWTDATGTPSLPTATGAISAIIWV